MLGVQQCIANRSKYSSHGRKITIANDVGLLRHSLSLPFPLFLSVSVRRSHRQRLHKSLARRQTYADHSRFYLAKISLLLCTRVLNYETCVSKRIEDEVINAWVRRSEHLRGGGGRGALNYLIQYLPRRKRAVQFSSIYIYIYTIGFCVGLWNRCDRKGRGRRRRA